MRSQLHVICCYLIIVIAGFCRGECKREYTQTSLNQTSGKFENLTGDALDVAIIDEISEQLKLHHKVELEELMIHKITRRVFRNFTHLTAINLQMNRIDELEDESFKENKKLAIINLADNKLTKINRKTFHGSLDELQDLKLAYNYIDFIETGAFDDLPNLEMIDLANNCLQRLGSDLFRKCPQLTFAHFADNVIAAVAHDMFNSKTELKYLDLSSNKLDEMPQIELKKILELSLSHNEIKIFNLNADDIERKKSPSIHHLRLANNLISEFVELDDHRSDIVIVDLSNNRLKEIDDFPFFLNLEVLSLSDNNISDFSLYNFGEKFPNLKILNIQNTHINCSDYRYIRNNFSPLMVYGDEPLNAKCLHNHNGSGSSGVDFEDYYDPVLTRLLAETSHEISNNLIVNRVILILILILLACFGVVCAFVTVNWRVKLLKRSSELLNNMEM